MSCLMLDLEEYATYIPSSTVCIRRSEDGPSLYGANRWGAFAVAKAGAELPDLLPLEELCDRCACAHVAGEA